MITEYNEKFIPFFLRITGTKQVRDKKDNRVEEEWGFIRHRPDTAYHLLSPEERKRNRDDDK